MQIKGFKKFVKSFSVIVLLLAFLLPKIDSFVCIAETIIVGTTEKKQSKGFVIEGAEYWDYNENYDKKRIWIDTGSGGNGEGGGMGGNEAHRGGNGGTGNEGGGAFGSAAGMGLGKGSQQNIGGQGGSTTGSGNGYGGSVSAGANGQNGNNGTSSKFSGSIGGSSGSAIADALRALRQDIDESRAESLQKVLETAMNQSLIAASIAERESMQESIQKKLAQESVKAKIMPQETQKIYDMIPDKSVYVPTTRRETQMYTEITAPTSARQNPNIYDYVPQTTQHEVFAVKMFEVQDTQSMTTEFVFEPTGAFKQTIAPPEIQMTTVSLYEPGDFIETTVRNDIFIPSLDVKAETLQPTVEEEATSIEQSVINEEDKQGESGEVSKEEQSETVTSSKDEDEGAGSKGGSDAQAEQNKEGDDGADENAGDASENGFLHFETEGEHTGKKVFELDTNGNIGITPDDFSVMNSKYVMVVIVMMLFLIGAIAFIFNTRDKRNKKSYF